MHVLDAGGLVLPQPLHCLLPGPDSLASMTRPPRFHLAPCADHALEIRQNGSCAPSGPPGAIGGDR